MSRPTLPSELRESAERFARSSLRAYLDQDWPIFFLHAGTALEQLAKFYLAEIDPSLVAAPDFNSLLHVRGLTQHASNSHRGMKTITVTEALKRVGQLVPTIPPLAEELAFVVNVRNGVAHAGRGEAKEAEDVLVPLIKACDQLLSRLKIDRWTFWGDLTEMVEARLSASAAAAEIRAKEAITAARLSYERRVSTMTKEDTRTLVKILQAAYEPDKYEQDLVSCPSCGSQAIVTGTTDIDYEPDWDYEGGEAFIVGGVLTVKLVPHALECRICGLELEGDEELAAAGIEESWELENVDPRDFEADIDW